MSDSGIYWLDEAQQRYWRALVMGTTLLFDRLDNDLSRELGISLAEYEILVRLSEREGRRMRMAQLADAMAHSRSRVTHTVGRLEKADLVERIKSPEDGRGVVCAMTDQRLGPAGRDGAHPRARRTHEPRRPGRRRGPGRARPGLGRGRRQARGGPPGEGDPLTPAEVLAPPPRPRRPVVRAVVTVVVLGLAAWGLVAKLSEDGGAEGQPRRLPRPRLLRGARPTGRPPSRRRSAAAALGALPKPARRPLERRRCPRGRVTLVIDNSRLALWRGWGRAAERRRSASGTITVSRPARAHAAVGRGGRLRDVPLEDQRRPAPRSCSSSAGRRPRSGSRR